MIPPGDADFIDQHKFTLRFRFRYRRASTRSAAHAKHDFIGHNLEQFQDSGIKTSLSDIIFQVLRYV